MLIKVLQLNCYRIKLLTADTGQLKDKIYDIETINKDTEIKIKKAIEREVCLDRFSSVGGHTSDI